ncbi:MAG: DUF4199 domain-containing protein [Cytophagales bacterium]|nr:MAG: DUF4199 domain-containing protein [Cytophagales bacterium]
MKNVLKNSLIFGLLGGILFISFLLLTYALTGKPLEADIKSLDFFVYLIALAGSLSWFRFKVNANKMKFWTGMGVGLMTNFVFLEKIAPQELNRYVKGELQNLDRIKKHPDFEKQFTKKQFESMYQDMKKVTAYDMAWYEWRVKIVVGIFMSFIISAVLRK